MKNARDNIYKRMHDNIMTLDVKIGRLMIHKEGNEEVEGIRTCPMTYHDVCNPEFTLWPRESYRSGSSGFWEFWEKIVGKLYHQMRRYPRTNDYELYPLKQIIDEINKLPNSQFEQHGIKVIDDIDFDRLKWFKFWSNRAVNLYGEDAYISFS